MILRRTICASLLPMAYSKKTKLGHYRQKRPDEAYVIFRDNAKKHPELWFVHSGLARIYSSQGKFDDAAKEMKLALEKAPDNQKSYVDGLSRNWNRSRI